MADYRGMGENPPLTKRSLDDATNAEWEALARARRDALQAHAERVNAAEWPTDPAVVKAQTDKVWAEGIAAAEPPLNVLAEAARITSGDRQQAYGHPLDNHSATAEFWTTWLRRRYGADMPALDYRDVCQMMIHQKSSRHANNPKRDNLVDQAGYAHNEDQADIEKAAREANG